MKNLSKFVQKIFENLLLRSYLNEKVHRPMPANLGQLKERINQELSNIPIEMIKDAVYSTKSRAVKLVEFGGEAFEGRAIRPGL